ncbi:hypothetical protein FS815_28690 [Agrobacterium vitis]|uniref:hypothetical protein n=1 Tax=Allorhizobium ampelinum TaxID=3025782 RepID=UPI001F40C196|nr:hypothetical protein [Allorhizobium ampelinum]MCF1450714.1 hypothetical protein [Allorhizobium ampelinum]
MIALAAHAQAFARCEDFQLPGKLIDEELFFRSDRGWLPIETLADVAPITRTNVDLLYVLETPLDTPRSGALAIKSGFNSLATHDLDEENVILKRPEIARTSCSPQYRSFDGEVNASNYDGYHDDGFKTRSYEDLKRFHILYNYGQNCRRTDSSKMDGFALVDRRSNLSQFSFDADIVKDGYRELVFWPFRLRSAFAGKYVVEGKRVQIRTYTTGSAGFECIRFQTKVGPGAFIRINDLEKRTVLGGDNFVWEWPLDIRGSRQQP